MDPVSLLTAAAMLANEANMTSAASFLQLGTGRKIPVQQKFDMKCLCSKDLVTQTIRIVSCMMTMMLVIYI